MQLSINDDKDMVIVINGLGERRDHIFQQLEAGGINPQKTYIITTSDWESLLPCQTWRDPYHKRLLTQGELKCSSHHLEAWRVISQSNNRGGLIIEDDALIHRKLDGLPLAGELTYLGGKPLEPISENLYNGLHKVGYTYWTIGYWISKGMAHYLYELFNPKAVIPSDEFISYAFGHNPNVQKDLHMQKPLLARDPHDAFILPNNNHAITPAGYWESATEVSKSAFNLQVYLVATDKERAKKYVGWWNDLGYSGKAIGQEDAGWPTDKPGGHEKLNIFRSNLSDDPKEVALLVDAYDTRPIVGPNELLQRFAEMNALMVISGEATLWPPRSANFDFESLEAKFVKKCADVPFYKYPCGGFVMGFATSWPTTLQKLEDPSQIHEQAILQDAVITGAEGEWQIDSEAYICQHLSHAENHVVKKNNYPYNEKTKCYPAVLHANGPASLELLETLASSSSEIGSKSGAEDNLDVDVLKGWNISKKWSHVEVAPGILQIEIMPKEVAQHLALAALEEVKDGRWQPLPGDKVPGDELRYNRWRPDEAEAIKLLLQDQLAPIINARWNPAVWHAVKDLFLIRYSTGRQSQIHLHNDISHFSCSLVLLQACKGGHLLFPRQGYDDHMVEPGTLLCWPSQITHPHMVTPVKKGQRVSLVVWTDQN